MRVRYLSFLCLCAMTRASVCLGEGSAPEIYKPPKPATSEQIERAIAKGIEFLVKTQNKNGSWGSPTRTKDLNIFAPVPGAHHAFRSGTTALCIKALIELDAAQKDSAAREALERGEDW